MTETAKLVKAAATEKDGKLRINCATAFRLSKEHKIPLKEIGQLCNELKIRISNCQLGCFE